MKNRIRSYSTEGIVLRRKDYGEADRLLTIYTKDHGKLSALAKGARKPQSRKTGHVELFMRSKFQLAEGHAYEIVTQAELINPHRHIAGDLLRTTYASYLIELLDRFTLDDEVNPAIYQLIQHGLEHLNEEDHFHLIARYYELRLLSLTGFQPQLFFCIASGNEIQQEDQFFSLAEGGLVSPAYKNTIKGCEHISSSAVKVLRFLQTRPWDAVSQLQLRKELHLEIERILRLYIQYHLEQRLQSADFLYRLRHEAELWQDDHLSF